MRRPLRWIALQLVLWPLLLLGADVGHRFATGYDGAAARERIVRVSNALTDELPDPESEDAQSSGGGRAPEEVALHPYLGFAPASLLTFQAQEAARAPVEGELTVLIVGGSVARAFAAPGSHGVGQMERVLRADPRFRDRPIRFLRGAFRAFKQPQQLHIVNHVLALGVQLDAVLNLDGFNEVALALANSEEGVHPSYPHFGKWAHLAQAGGMNAEVRECVGDITAARRAGLAWVTTVRRWGLERSSVLGTWALAKLERYQRQFLEASARYVTALASGEGSATARGPEFVAETGAALETCVRVWEESSRSLHALCRERGIDYLHLLQPTLHDPGAKVPTEEEAQRGGARDAWLVAAREGYPLLRAGGARLAAAGVSFVDGSGVFRATEETVYVDACHFNQRGNAILGDAVGKALLAIVSSP